VFPFAIYLIIGELVPGLLVGYDVYHLYVAYALRTVIVGGILVRYRSLYTELNERRVDVMALLVGVLIFAWWVGLEGYYPAFSGASSHFHFDPSVFGTEMLLFLLSLRLVGSVLVAAHIEELFCRSFLMRYIIDPEKWADIPVGTYTFMSFVVVALFFGFVHFQWLPGLLTGITLNLLLYKRRNIFSCVQAHAMANLLLFFYVVYTKSWFFW